MSNNYFNQITANSQFFLDASKAAEEYDCQLYIILSPLTDRQYHYTFKNGWVLLKPGYPITFVCESDMDGNFDEYIEDFKEDLGHIVDKYHYSDKLGRPRSWNSIFTIIDSNNVSFNDYLQSYKVSDDLLKRKIEIFISLLIGSINEASAISLDVPENLLDKIKSKIILFDLDQTRFLYQEPDVLQKIVHVQGLAGTGKTELLLHKLKDTFLSDIDAVIAFTCHNKVLAAVLWNRLIQFFNQKNVNRQIDNDKLKCFHAWGSSSNANSGTLSYICYYYSIPFYSLKESGNFNNACLRTIENLKKSEKFKEGNKSFTYMFIDESQDFPESFFILCDMVTEKRIYAAGDIFQNIFTIAKYSKDLDINVILNRCYRTDPRTFMFAHGMGLGLFEKRKINWLTDDDWIKCGYSIEKIEKGSKYRFSRKPVRRFEDIPKDFQSIELYQSNNMLSPVIRKIDEWREDYPNLMPDDIGIIFIDAHKNIYDDATSLGSYLSKKYDWECNFAYTSKAPKKNTVFISNRNNVKGLEFPFVICITNKIQNTLEYRHTLYTMLSRSHLQTILIVNELSDDLRQALVSSWSEIMKHGSITAVVPAENDISRNSKYSLSVSDLKYSLAERVEQMCIEKDIPEDSANDILGFIKKSSKKEFSDSDLSTAIDKLWDTLRDQ